VRQYALQANGPAADVHLAFEQLYGIRRRDVSAYRPLIEFCLGLPSDQFASHGIERRLARRMAKGRMPESQRLETRHGQHNIDWHARMTPRRGELMRYAESMRNHPWLSQVADIDRMQDLLERWPEAPQHSWEEDFPRMLGLPRIVLAAQFIGMAEGRNDL
jgi:asparagine synthase (glutamine-hydrolysing)